MAKFQPRKIQGRWRDGYALDLHTLSSTPIGYNEYGHMQFDTKRSEIGELLYRLKYGADKAAIAEIVDALCEFTASWNPGAEMIVPVPPSSQRNVQPVILIAEVFSRRLGIPLVDCAKGRETHHNSKTSTTSMRDCASLKVFTKSMRPLRRAKKYYCLMTCSDPAQQ